MADLIKKIHCNWLKCNYANASKEMSKNFHAS